MEVMTRPERMHRSGTSNEGKSRMQLANQGLPENAYYNDGCRNDSTIY